MKLKLQITIKDNSIRIRNNSKILDPMEMIENVNLWEKDYHKVEKK